MEIQQVQMIITENLKTYRIDRLLSRINKIYWTSKIPQDWLRSIFVNPPEKFL